MHTQKHDGVENKEKRRRGSQVIPDLSVPARIQAIFIRPTLKNSVDLSSETYGYIPNFMHSTWYLVVTVLIFSISGSRLLCEAFRPLHRTEPSQHCSLLMYLLFFIMYSAKVQCVKSFWRAMRRSSHARLENQNFSTTNFGITVPLYTKKQCTL